MVRVIDKPNDPLIRLAKSGDKQKKLSDGAGLFFLIHPNGSKYWRIESRDTIETAHCFKASTSRVMQSLQVGRSGSRAAILTLKMH